MRKLSFSAFTTLGLVGVIVSVVASIGRALSKIKETTVSFVSNRLHSPTPKIASAVVGIGLFAAPMESAQAQVLSPSHVTGVTVETIDLSGGGDALGIQKISVDFDVFDTSSDYIVDVTWPLGKYNGIWDFPDSAYHTASRRLFALPPVRDNTGWYWTVKFKMREDSSDFIEVYIFLDPLGNVESAAAYDSDGNWYDVPLTVE